MPLSWNEITARATRFSENWKDARYEKGETQSFYNEFFEVFGKRRRDVAVYEAKVKKLDNRQGFIDLFWPGKLLIEQKSADRDLDKAREQATDYFLALKEHEKPRYLLLSDFQRFEFLDLEENKEHRFAMAELPNFVRLFDFIAGYQTQTYRDQDPVNIEASELMAVLHRLLEANGYTGKDLERVLVRLMFCFFADDTGVFEPDSFLLFVENFTKEDGSDLGTSLGYLFEVLDTPVEKRQKNLPEELARFPYVNGSLFFGATRIPSFNRAMREALLECCYFNWAKVSPALFGSLFQNVMLPDTQRRGGAHYTSERNILKTIHPLFMDDLRDEFERIKNLKRGKSDALIKFQKSLGELTFFDPACGCGNFLILAYRELRELEINVLEERYPGNHRTGVLNVSDLSVVDVDQFYGIEIEEFAVRIAETALWLTDHQMNMKLSASFGQAFARLPLTKSPTIVHANALTTDWKTVLPPHKCSFILGNPPFVGKHFRTKTQTQELEIVFTGVKGAKELDYVTCWFYKAAQFIQETNIKVAFVSTNSITQGEQVGILWAELINRFDVKIFFAHQTFKWTLDERKADNMHVAAVYVVIIGFSVQEPHKRTIFEYETVKSVAHAVPAANINAYLIDGPTIFIPVRNSPLCNVPLMQYGSKPADDGNFFFTEEEKNEFLQKEPNAAKFIRPFIGAQEFINRIKRYCLWLKDASPEEWRKLPEVKKRVESVKKFRLASKKVPTQKAAESAELFTEIRQPTKTFIIIPRVSSETRRYIPMDYFYNGFIVGDSCFALLNPEMYHLGILMSKMHMAWTAYVCGRLEGRFRYSNTIVYNNFPWPEPTAAQRKSIAEKAQAVLDARALYPNSSLADLYDPLAMPRELVRAHNALDKAVEKAYRKEPFETDKARIEYLFFLYQKLTAGLMADLVTLKKKNRSKKNNDK